MAIAILETVAAILTGLVAVSVGILSIAVSIMVLSVCVVFPTYMISYIIRGKKKKKREKSCQDGQDH